MAEYINIRSIADRSGTNKASLAVRFGTGDIETSVCCVVG